MPLAAFLPAIIGGVAAVGGALISSHAVNSASNAASNAAAQNDALQQRTYDSNKALIQPGIDRGNAAADELNGFLGLGGDPAKINAAFNTYLNSTGYQFDRQQGIDAIDQNKAVSGLLDSGSTLKALDAWGTGEAQQYGQNYINSLGSVADRGQSGITALVGAGQNNANQQSANNNSAATNTGNAAIAGANNTNALIGNALSAYAMTRGQSSYGGGGNAFSTAASGGAFGLGG